MAQNAYYHSADSYLQTDQKTAALNAFKRAAEMKFDPIIAEDALLNYARLSYEIEICEVLLLYCNALWKPIQKIKRSMRSKNYC